MNDPRLVFDIGMHNGTDTRYYLRKGYRVVAVEANPALARAAAVAFAAEIAAGMLTIENVGIAEARGVKTFYVNLDVDEWSSFDRGLGTRQGTRYEEIEVPTQPLDHLVGRYGMPHFLKVDVEGFDPLVVRQLRRTSARPRYVSLEDSGIDALVALYEVGVREFKFSNQLGGRDTPCRVRTVDGVEFEQTFGVASSGLFGEDLPGPWLDPAHAFEAYVRSVRPPGEKPIGGWWDIHGRFPD